MASVQTLMGAGMPAAQARNVGTGTFATGISAAGSDNTDATPLVADFNVVTTAESGTGVILPDVEVGSDITVVNGGANALLVYPNSGAQLNNQTATTAGRTVGAGKAGIFRRGSVTHWAAIADAAA